MNALLLWLLAAWAGGVGHAHAMWPASLRLVEGVGGGVHSRWEVPLRAGQPLPLTVVFPAHCAQDGPATVSRGARTHRIDQVFDCGAAGLTGHTLRIDGFGQTQADALVVIQHADGRTTSALLRAQASTLAVPAPGAPAPSASRYLSIGVEHILGGVDHLFFVIGLVLVAGRRWGVLLKTVTAFTLTHSITLALSTLGIVRFPTASVEAVIALSILLLAVEVSRDRSRSWTLRAPWAVAGVSGLVHGMGFAGALTRIGLPEQQVPLALLNFNVGVEAGQLGVVALAVLCLTVARRLALPPLVRRLPVWVMGSWAAFWLFERTSDILRL